MLDPVAPAPVRAARSWPAHLAAVGLGLGVIVMVAGTFAPWLRSGQVTRNSYRTAGLLSRLLDLHGAPATALDAIALLPVLCAVGAVLFVVGWRRVAAAGLGLIGLLLTALSVTVLLAPGGHGISAATAGPTVTAVGAALTVVAAIASLVVHKADRRDGQVVK